MHFLKDIPNYTNTKETGSSFVENARLKAQDLKKHKPKYWVLGEDSGLEVPALNKAPGIYSARYAGSKATDLNNMNLLLKNMEPFTQKKQREAYFISHIVALSPTGHEFCAKGIIHGHISYKATGENGFGYDPIFVPKGETLSFAELGVEYKNKSSHRFYAIKNIMPYLKNKNI